MSPARRRLLLAVGAFWLYGGWAFLANRSHGTATAARALVTQGGLSFLSTPELMATVAPVLAVGTVYCGGYGLGLVRLDR